MANYDAQINILVAGQRNIQNLANQLNAIEDSIGQIERRWRSATGALQRANIRLGVTGTQQPRGEGGRFARDPDRRARQLAFQDRRRALVDQRLARLAVSRERAQAVAARSSIDSNETLIRQTERRILLESRLNSANELFQRRLQQLSRGGGGRSLPQELQDQARSIQSAYQAAGGAASRNVRLVQSLATELGRVVERQNEFNRLQALSSKGFEAGRRLQERITAASSIADLPSRRVRDVRGLATEVIEASRRGDQQAYSEALRRATAATSRLERDARELADAMREQEREIARIAKIAPRSPVLGGVNFPDSPLALKNAADQQKKITQDNEKASAAAVSLEKQRQAALEKILQVEEKIRSARRVSAKEAQDYYFQAGLSRLALPLGDVNLPQIRGGARSTGPSMIQGAAMPRVREVLGGGRTADEAQATLRLAQANTKLAQSVKGIDAEYNRFLPDTKMLNASARGIQRLTTNQEEFNEAVVSGTRFQQKYNQEQERLRKIYGTPMPAGTAAPVKGAGATRVTGFPSSPIRGGIGFPGSPIFKETPFLERRFGKRGGAAVSEGLIGGAFPLLFGQGVGAAVGGAAGGFGGGFAGGGLGFGLSLVGTALGTAFDTAVQSAQELGRALEKPVENFDQLAQQSFFSSKALEDTIKKTIEYGDTATASALIQEEAIKKLGVGGVQNLKVLGTESDRLNRAFAELGQQMQAVAAGPLASVIGFFANIAGQAAAAGRVRLLRSNLDEQQAGQFNQEILQRLQQQGIQRGFFAPSAPTDAEIGMLLERGALQDIVDKWQAIEVKGKVKLDPKQKIESEINALQKRLEAMDIGKSLFDQVRSANREQEDLDKQRADLVRSYEESIGSIRKQVEDEIRNKRFATLEKENQLLDAQGQIRLKQLQIANQAAIAQAGVGQRPEVEQAAKEVAQLVAQFTEQQVSAEEEAASIKRNAALEVQKIDSEAAQFKANIEKEVSRLNIETARRVDDINLGVTRRNEEYDQNRFKLEKRIAELQLKLEEDRLKVQVRSSLAAGDSTSFLLASGSLRLVQEAQKELAKQAAPSPLGGVPTGSIGGQGVPTTGLDRATADYRAAVENYVAAQLRLNELDVVKNAQDFALGIAELANKTDATLAAIQTREADAEIERLRYIELVNAGLTDTVAQKVIELETTKRVALAVYDTAIAQLESKIVAEATTDQVKEQNKAYQDQIDILRKRKDALEGKFGEVDTVTGRGTGAIGGAIESDRGKKIQDFIAQTKAELNDLESVAIRVSQGIGDAVGNSIASGISGLIEGTTTAKEVFAGFLKDIGDILIKEGTRMIAMYAAIALAKQLAGLFSGGVSGGAGGAGASDLPTAITSTSPVAANGAYFDNGIAAFAKGGTFTNSVVSSPTLFQFADGGVTRTGLMGEAGPEAIMPLKRGADGKLGVQVTDTRTALARQAGNRQTNETRAALSRQLDNRRSNAMTETMQAKPLEVKYESTVINRTEYVTAEQHQKGLAQAAERGRALTLQALQNSPKTRRKVGV